jgi:NAD(P)-dependent dehydrogenase (short-subunit alcohol dehydrogenase family)
VGRLDGKVAVITGANSGIGLATAELFAQEDARVYITGRRQAELDDAVRRIGNSAIGVQGDVSNLDDLDRLYATVDEHGDRIDVLFANAGVGEFAPLGEISEEQFDKTFGVNVKGLLFTVQKALPLLRDGGSVILNASTAASTGAPALSIYSATKAAIRSFARTWTLDLADRNIRVNAISPGPISTPGIRELAESSGKPEEAIGGLVARVAWRRLGEPEEVAKAILFLASDDSSFVTGSEVFVDGGQAQV